MNPLDGPINVAPNAVPVAPPVAPSSVPSALDPVAREGAGAKTQAEIEAKRAKGVFGTSQAKSLPELLIPIAAAGGAFVQPEGFFGKKALTIATGFKVGEAAELANKIGPGAGLFLAPEPFGVLPERFFNAKPHIPGTNVYLDPLYNYERFKTRKEDRQRAAAAAAQLDALQQLVPTLSTPDLSAILANSALRAEAIKFASPLAVEKILLSELDRRRAAEGAVAPAVTQTSDLQTRIGQTAELVGALLRGDTYTAGAILDYLATPPAPGSVQPEYIQPVNAKAIRNRDRATGIRRELVSERADP